MKHRDARKRLRGNWMPAIFIWLVRLAIWTFPLLLEQLLSLLLDADTGNAFLGGAFLDDLSLWPYAAALLWSAVLDLVLFSPLLLGQYWFFARVSRGQAADISHLFAPYRNGCYFRAVGWRLRIWGMNGIWGFLFLAPGALILSWGLGVSGNAAASSSLFAVIFFFCGGSILLLGFLALRLWMLRVQPAALLLEEGRSLRSAFHQSKKAMKGYVGELTGIYLRLAGWAAACLLIVPGFYAYPLIQTVRTAYWQERLSTRPVDEKLPAVSPSLAVRSH